MVLCAVTSPLFLLGQGSGQNSIRGKVTGPGGRPVEVKVQLQNESGYVVDTVYTDSNGEFVFRGVRDGVYHVFVDDDRYRRTEVSTHVAWTINPLAEAFITLEPRTRSTETAQSYANGSDTISVRELKAKFPKNAVKEYEKGIKKTERGDTNGAIANYEKAVALAPDMYPALNNLGNSYLQNGQFAQAEAVFLRALSADPQAAEPCINLGHLFYQRQRYDQAEKFLLQGLERSPQSALGHFLLGSTYARLGNLKSAESNLLEALQGDEPAMAAHLELANLYLNTHRLRSAREQLEAFLKAQPQDPQADHIRQVLSRLNSELAP